MDFEDRMCLPQGATENNHEAPVTIPGLEPLPSRNAAEPHEEPSPDGHITEGLKFADLLHGGYEMLANGAKTMGDLDEEAGHLLAHGSRAVPQAVAGMLGPITFAGSTAEAIMGTHEAFTSKSADGIGNGTTEGMEGGAGMFGSFNTMLSAIGVGGKFAASGGPAGAAATAGMMFGHYGDEQSKKEGIFGHGSNGDNRAASDWAADKGLDADAAVRDYTHSKALGRLAGGTVSLGEGVAAAPKAVEAGARGISHAADRLFDWMVDD